MSVNGSRLIWGWIFLSVWQVSFAQKELRVGIIKYKTEEAVTESYIPLFQYVADKLDVRLRYEIITDGSLGYRLNDNEFDIGVFTLFPYLAAKQDFDELDVFASHVVNQQKSFRGGIVVKKSSGIRTFADLIGKHVLFVKETSTSGFKYPEGIFKEHGITLDSLSGHSFSGGHFQSLMALLKEETDAVAINLEEMDALEQEGRDQLLVLSAYDVPYHAYLFGPDVLSERRQLIADIMFEAHKNPATAVLFDNPLGIESWYPQDDEPYNALRRYSSLVRVKPSVSLMLDIREGARKKLEEKGDIISVIQDKLEVSLMNSKRFSSVQSEEGPNLMKIRLGISYLDELYHFQVFMGEKSIREGDVTFVQLRTELAEWVVQGVLKELPIETELLTNGERWFITYGKNDGLDPVSYEFSLQLGGDKELRVRHEDILSMNEVNTDFAYQETFQTSRKMIIQYRQDPDAKAFVAGNTSLQVERGFFDDLDNVWGVIGLVVALLTIGLGSFLTGRKKRRFRAMLYESNDLLREYIEGKQRIDNKIIDQKEKVNRSLEKGVIDENQFLILKHRLEDIDHVIEKYLAKPDSIPQQLSDEINVILKDGTITEKEFTRIISLVKKNEN